MDIFRATRTKAQYRASLHKADNLSDSHQFLSLEQNGFLQYWLLERKSFL